MSTELAQQNKPLSLTQMLTKEDVKKRFEEMLGKKAAGFISSIISATKSNPTGLGACKPESIISAAVIAATLDLPIQNNLGFAALVPYNDEAQFQMMWKGYVQLAMRTGQYKTMNVCEVFEGELVKQDRFTGEFEFDETKKSSDKIIGYTAYFKMVNGFEKRVYWTVAQVTAHAKKYSQSFKSSKEYVVKNSRWTLDFDAMAKKTVLKMLLSKYGILSVDMQLQQAIMADQAVPGKIEDAEFEYVDNKELAPTPVDKQAERISLMIEDATSIEQLDKLFKDVPDSQLDLFLLKKEKLSQKK